MHQFDNPSAENAHELAQTVAQFIKDCAPHLNVAGAQIADIGCGTGLLTWYVQDLFWHAQLVGVDTNEAVLSQAANTYPDISFISNQNLAGLQEKFDLVYAAFTLHHVVTQEQRAFLQALVSLLKPGGICLIIELNPLHLPTAASFIFNAAEKGARMILPWQLMKLGEGLPVCTAFLRLPHPKNRLSWLLRSFFAIVLKKN
jgi:trans-aconitate methyltransferase